ncbi:MAG: gamma-glutamylcyclotransferase [Rhizobiales bacterium]|nr:gamma-glutamylcyclotransferase [Hyphomicrobiales bacterium]
MPRAPLRLTPELVERVARIEPDEGYEPHVEVFSDTDYEDHLQEFLAPSMPDDPIWVFAYGSLIWKPGFAHVETRRGVAEGWQRSFCLRITRFRGTRAQPGLMMQLDRGGSCEGLLMRLAPGVELDELRGLWRREMSAKPPSNMPRWIDVTSGPETIRAIAFTANPAKDNYDCGLPADQVAETLVLAAGHWGSGAEYLFHTVTALERAGIHDPYLWELQEMVAERIAALPPVNRS